MDTNEFERRARGQSFRPVPAHWREEILGLAGKAAFEESRITDDESRRPRWREWLWPCPQAWAALAAAWLVILFLNVASREPGQTATAPGRPPARVALMAFRERQRMLAELADPSEPAEPPKPVGARPRSEISKPTSSIQLV